MKNKSKIIGCFFIMLLVMIMNITTVWADPNSSKGFADFSDGEAETQAQQQTIEQERNHNVTELKSSDNYLSHLQVEGYTLVPEFDKQTLEYEIREKVKDSNINIKFNSSNEKSTVNSNKVKIDENNNEECKIEVTAENGAVRTYIIKYKYENSNEIKLNVQKDIENQEKIKEENEEETSVENNKTEEEKKNEEVEKNEINYEDNKKENYTSTNTNIYFIIGIVIVIIIIILIVLKMGKNNKGKH